MTAAVPPAPDIAVSMQPSPEEYRRRIRAWTMYDWANSAFATTILAAVLPVYFSQVAGSTLPSATVATTYWSTGLSLSLFIIAVISPILGTVSDIMRGKKRFLAIFAGVGIVSTGLLVLVGTGDWILASILGIIGRIGFSGSITFYDALLPHVAREEDRDMVSARGYAMGYLGGGILLAINIVMIQMLPGTWGPRLSFLSVAIWWAVFSIPLLRRVPEPHTATARLAPGESVITASFKRLGGTFSQVRRYRELFKYLVAFLIYNDGIGTIIGVAAIYGAELGFGAFELILALLMVQFVGIPYSLVFGRLPRAEDKRRPIFLAFIIFNVVALPLVGVLGARLLPPEISGQPMPAYVDTANAVGEGVYAPGDPTIELIGDWTVSALPAALIETRDFAEFAEADAPAAYELSFNGQNARITYLAGPQGGIWTVFLDGSPYLDSDTDQLLTVDSYSATQRFDEVFNVSAAQAGEHLLRVESSGESSPESQGARLTLQSIEVLPPVRSSNLAVVLGLIAVVEVVCLLLALLLGRALFSGLASKMDTKSSVLLALVVYAIIAVWGFFLNSVVEFWLLAWMVAIVQGGSQALSRSLYTVMSPAAKSGEFFGLFGIMEKFSAVIGPALFAAAGILFGSSRPAVLSLIVIFFIGGYLLTRVDVAEGRRVAQEEDALALEAERS